MAENDRRPVLGPPPQQLDVDGRLHDLVPQHEPLRLFEHTQHVRGQLYMDTDKAS
jgi:hypothetical protein